MSREYSPALLKTIEATIGHYPKKEAALLPVLHLVQKEFGFISAEDERKVAELLGIHPIRIREAMTFYTMFHSSPIGKYHLQVCSNLSCSLAGGESVLGYIERKLGIRAGETTGDRKFTLSEVECLGACEQAPCMMVNFDYYGGLDINKIDRILESLD
jgi:NADH-quinone oxidoreductase E subunit